jgi:hypothetical protein
VRSVKGDLLESDELRLLCGDLVCYGSRTGREVVGQDIAPERADDERRCSGSASVNSGLSSAPRYRFRVITVIGTRRRLLATAASGRSGSMAAGESASDYGRTGEEGKVDCTHDTPRDGVGGIPGRAGPLPANPR